MEKKNVIFRTKEELKAARENAWSIGAYNIPELPTEYLGSIDEKNDIYHYYRDKDGKYFFESERTLRFDREMREARKKRRRKISKSGMEG